MVVVVEEEEVRLLAWGLGGAPLAGELLGFAEGVPAEDVPGVKEASLRVRAPQARAEVLSARAAWRVGRALSNGRRGTRLVSETDLPVT